MITLETLRPLSTLKDDRLALFVEHLNAACEEFQINTPVRVQHFLAQTSHETLGFRFLREIWGPTDEQKKYDPPGRKAQALGNIVAGDGFRYRGRGLIHITGRANYASAGSALGMNLLEYPEQLEYIQHACRSGAWWWKEHGCNELADAGDAERVTRRINGGTNGLEDRLARLEKVQAVA